MRRTLIIILAALIAIGGAAATPATANTSTVRLISKSDFLVGCITDYHTRAYQVEHVDLVAERREGGRWHRVWQSVDGVQFVVVPIAQNQPWGCLPVSGRVEIPADWTKD